MHKKESESEVLAPDEDISSRWSVGAGMTLGRDHHRAWRNAQDAVATHTSRTSITLVVADGCGSAPHSEFGARFAVEWVRQRASVVGDIENGDALLTEVREHLPAAICTLAKAMTPKDTTLSTTLERFFLFTLLVARMTDNEVVVDGCGDGVIVVNDEVIPVGVREDNAPDYLSYRIVDPARGRWRRYLRRQAREVDVLAVATDGASALTAAQIAAAACASNAIAADIPTLPGFVRAVGLRPNPSLLQKRLRAFARVPHLLNDDTALAVARRETRPQ